MLSSEGAEIDDLAAVRDGDHLYVVSAEEQEEDHSHGLSFTPSDGYDGMEVLLMRCQLCPTALTSVSLRIVTVMFNNKEF